MKALEYRTELKHIITLQDSLIVRSRLKPVMKLDPNAGINGKYKIRSLYFDTAEDKALMEKIDGLPIREKYRIRFYNNNEKLIRLEKKSKQNGSASKSGTTISKEQVIQIIGNDNNFLPKSSDPFLQEFYWKVKSERLLPKIIVDYDREAYICHWGNVRVTLDTRIKSSLGSMDVFNPNLINVFSVDPGLCILEIKYDHFIPDFIQDLVQLNSCSATSASKYVACRNYQ
jgi:hypothetical protein